MSEEYQDSIVGEVITLVDDDDQSFDFRVEEVLELNGKRYVVLSALEPDQMEEKMDEDDAIIFRLDTDENGEEVFTYIEDDEEWEAAVDAYNDLIFEEE